MSSYTIWHGPKSVAKGRRVTTWTGTQLVESLGNEFTVFESFGHVNGVEGFSKEAMTLDGDHLNVHASDGSLVIRHPLSRKHRILVK